jgi:Xaa-Pro aminopeptidase
MDEARLDATFLPPSSDLEYLTGLPRDVPSFGQTAYAHGWVAGAFLAPGRAPLFVLPRMVLAFHLFGEEPGATVVVDEADDGAERFATAVRSLGNLRGLGIGARTWGETVLHLRETLPRAEFVNATPLVNELRRVKSSLELELMTHACGIVDEAMAATAPKVEPGVTTIDLAEEVEHQMRVRGSRTPSFPTHIFTFGRDDSRDSQLASGNEPIRDGEAVMFDFGAVHRGYCSDFGRTVVCGEPPPEYDRIYDLMLAAQESGRAAAVPGALARDVNAACRAPIEDAGLGEHFRHRMGHGIGLDVHEQPFISVEDETPLEAGMTFTDEPSILWPGHFGVRIEDIVVCEDGGGRRLNALPPRV